MIYCPACSREVGLDRAFCVWCAALLISPSRGRRAGFARRFFAALLDPIAFWSSWLGATAIIGAVLGAAVAVLSAIALLVVLIVVQLRLFVAGQTLGKALLGERVVRREDGGPPGFWRMLLRETFGKCVSGFFFGVGFFWAIFDRDGQAWHDKIAGTLVISSVDDSVARRDDSMPLSAPGSHPPTSPIDRSGSTPSAETSRAARHADELKSVSHKPEFLSGLSRTSAASRTDGMRVTRSAASLPRDAFLPEEGDDDVKTSDPARPATLWSVTGPVAAALTGLTMVFVAIWPPLRLTNRLPFEVRVLVGNERIVTLAPHETRTVFALRRASIPVRWEARSSVGGALGSAGSTRGEFKRLGGTSPFPVTEVTFGATVGNDRYFVPTVTNESAVDVLLYVNERLVDVSTAACCIIRAGAVRHAVGVFRLEPQSTVRGAYPTGESATFETLAPFVDTMTGQLRLRLQSPTSFTARFK